MNVFFDVLDTLLTEDGVPRPHARKVFGKLNEMGHTVYLWSSAGEGYAAAAAELLGVTDLVAGCFSKRCEPEVGVDFAVDDDATIVGSYGGHCVAPFGGNTHDVELLKVAAAVGAS